VVKGARFGAFELDLERRELRKRGIRLRLPDQSFEILAMLVARPGEIVGREEIRRRLWPNGTIVEFEHSVNSAVRRLRDALGDGGSTPRFIETVPRQGYRFRERVEPVGPPPDGPRYRLLEEAGRGAMGIVYRAEDVRLGRRVALKVLPEDVANDPAALERLRREARISASLNHPGICTLHGIEEHDGRLCLVMEFLEGTSLDRLIATAPLRFGQAIDIAIQVSAALSFAHARGIVHRDIKPGNLFVTRDGSAKVMDFGIAVAAGDTGTATGGTPSYASPEQSRGGSLDGRSDIFSLGTVLYEMLTGRRLFRDGNDAVPPVWPADLPRAAQRIVARCVESDPANRFQTADELKTALENLKKQDGRSSNRLRWAVAAVIVGLAVAAAGITWKRVAPPNGRTRVQSIAVLPMLNLSGDPAQEYFADGMTDALTSDLAEIGGLHVISRTSAMTYKGSRKSSSEIAARLKVDALLEGSVVRAGSRVRVVAQLIEASTDTHLWSKTYERELTDVLRLQSDLALAIAGEIRVAITPEQKTRLAGKRPVKPEAYEAYLKGMFHLNKFTEEGFSLGISYLQQAIEKDPADPAAYAALGLGYAMMAHDGFPEEFARAKAAARKSLELGGPVPEAYAALGMVELYFDWDFAAGGRDLQRALELNPSLAEARRAYSWYLLLAGRGKEALVEMRRAEDLEPLVPIFPNDLGWQYLRQGDLDAALAETRKALELDPDFAQTLALEGFVYLARKMDREALAAHQKAAAADPAWRWALARTYARLGQKAQARKMASEIARKPSSMDRWGLAALYTELGDSNEALRWLEHLYKSRFSWLPWDHISGTAPAGDLFAPLRADPRFQELGRRIGVP
jgi:TolB-like protein/DNA-binding winged helix-turn-helix (wHTH) protein/Tfp pilus assembly protein PilF